MQALHTIECPYNEIKDLPSTIGDLAELRVLDLRDNHIRTLPPQIGKLGKLIKLQLGLNKLVTLPAETSKLWALHTLQLEANQLTSLPDFRDLLNVRELHVDDHVAHDEEQKHQMWTAAIQAMGAVLKVNPTGRTPAQVKMLKRAAARSEQRKGQPAM